jgi:hypothetical protein
MQRFGRRLCGLATVAGAFAGVLIALPVSAQNGQDAVARCRSLTTDAERIACLEAAVMGTGSQPAAPAAAPTPAPATAEPPPRRGFRLPGVPFIGGGDDERSQPQVFSSEAPEAAELGAEQVANIDRAAGRAPPRGPEPRMTAGVVSAREVPYKRLEVELDNGQVWRQTQADENWDSRRYRDPIDVEIWASAFGGYRMRIVEQDRTLRVERAR